jgi:hypothetical protein
MVPILWKVLRTKARVFNIGERIIYLWTWVILHHPKEGSIQWDLANDKLQSWIILDGLLLVLPL